MLSLTLIWYNQPKPPRPKSAKDVTRALNEDDSICRKTLTARPFNVCIYNDTEDIYISKSLSTSGIWEPDVTAFLTKIFKTSETLTFIDIGANVGYFSLLAASFGVNAIAVEPIERNVAKLLKAIGLNWMVNEIRVFQYAMSNKRVADWMQVPTNNQGGGKIVMEKEWKAIVDERKHRVETVTLDDLADFITTEDVIIKIDVGELILLYT